MKNTILGISFLLCSLAGFGQSDQSLTVFEADSSWFKEIIEFPFGFAREIAYEGFADIRFAKGWAKKVSTDFWTYTYAWHVKGVKKQSVELLEKHLAMYFNGLSRPDNNDTRIFPMTTVLFLKNEATNKEVDYLGKIRLYDRFHTKDMLTLYSRVKTHYCEANNTSTIVFRFSAKPFAHDVWQKFNEVKLRDDVCDN